MSEDRSGQNKGWFDKLTHAFSDEPRTPEDLLTDLRQASDDNLLDSKALTNYGRAMPVADQQIRDGHVPPSQIGIVEADHNPKEVLPE